MQTRRLTLKRQRALENAGGHTLFFQSEGMGRRSRPYFFDFHEVPPFEGESAVFECEQRGGRWRIVRRVEGS